MVSRGCLFSPWGLGCDLRSLSRSPAHFSFLADCLSYLSAPGPALAPGLGDLAGGPAAFSDQDALYRRLSSVQSLSRVRLFGTPWTAARQASLSITNSQSWLRLISIESVMPSNHLILCLSPCLPAFSLSQHQCLFQCIRSSNSMAKVLEFQLQHQSIKWIFRTDFL